MNSYRIDSSGGEVIVLVVFAAVLLTVFLFLSPVVESLSWSSLTG